jgi:hypothetical protein
MSALEVTSAARKPRVRSPGRRWRGARGCGRRRTPRRLLQPGRRRRPSRSRCWRRSPAHADPAGAGPRQPPGGGAGPGYCSSCLGRPARPLAVSRCRGRCRWRWATSPLVDRRVAGPLAGAARGHACQHGIGAEAVLRIMPDLPWPGRLGLNHTTGDPAHRRQAAGAQATQPSWAGGGAGVCGEVALAGEPADVATPIDAWPTSRSPPPGHPASPATTIRATSMRRCRIRQAQPAQP